MKKYKRYNYSYSIITLKDGDEIGYEAVIPKFPNCHVYADTISELDEMVMFTIGVDIEERKERGYKIPEEDYVGSKSGKKPKGKIPLRIKPELHDRIKLLAQASNISLNRFIEETLEEKVGFQTLPK